MPFEIGASGGLQLAKSFRNKNNLTHFTLDGNMFGKSGRQALQSELKDNGRLQALGSLR